jgi:LmbE family N-acetylglucosaminyl deacetylase
VFAHPDDADFSCSGTVAKWASEGCNIYYALTTSGDKGSHDPEMTSEGIAAIREEEQKAAAKVLGVKECVFLRHEDGFVEDTPELRGEIVKLIRRFRPEVVMTFDPHRRSHNHRDHRITGQVTMDAVFPLSRSHLYYPEHLAEGLEPYGVNDMLLFGSDQVNYKVNISNYIEQKMEAAWCHRSQMRNRTREEFETQWRERARQAARGKGLAESFRHVSFHRDRRAQQNLQQQPWWRLDKALWNRHQ